MTGRRAAVALAASLFAGAALAAPAGGAASVPCAKPSGAKLLAADLGSKAWRVTIDGGFAAPDLRRFVACEHGHAPFLFEHGDTGADSLTDVPSAAISGRYLAYGRIRKFGLGTSRATMIVRDLRTHHATFVRRAVSKQVELEDFDDVVVRANGNVAWIASNGDGGEGVITYEVRKHDAGGSKLLDSGVDIAPHSLKLTSDGTVSWRRAGVVKDAPLPVG